MKITGSVEAQVVEEAVWDALFFPVMKITGSVEAGEGSGVSRLSLSFR